MKKTKLLALFSTALLLVSCGGTKYTNSSETKIGTFAATVNEEFYARSDSFTYKAKTIFTISEVTITQENTEEGLLENTEIDNTFKTLTKKDSVKMSFKGDESNIDTAKKILRTLYVLSYTDAELNDLMSGKKVTKSYEEGKYVTHYVSVDTENSTFARL